MDILVDVINGFPFLTLVSFVVLCRTVTFLFDRYCTHRERLCESDCDCGEDEPDEPEAAAERAEAVIKDVPTQ